MPVKPVTNGVHWRGHKSLLLGTAWGEILHGVILSKIYCLINHALVGNSMRAKHLPQLIIIGMLLCGVSLPAAGLDLSLPDLGNPSTQVLSTAEEARIGRQMMNEIRTELDLVEDPAINAYVRALGARIATASDSGGSPLQFFVLADDRINAFAMPGGYIGVHSGLITASTTESELGAVVAHEIAHITQRHIARRLAAATSSNLRSAALVIAGLLISTQDPQAGMAAATSGMASGIDSQLAYSRDHEREADRVGLRIMANARLDPHGMPDFFQILMDDSRYRRDPPAFLSTHPLTDARIADARALANDVKPSDAFESPDYAYIRGRTLALQAPSRTALIDELRKERNETTPSLNYALAIALINGGNPQEATVIVEDLLAQQGEHALLSLALAEAAFADDDPKTAEAIVDEALSLFPGDLALRAMAVELKLAEGQANAALRLTRNLVQQSPQAVELWTLHAQVASAADNPAESALAMAQYHAVQGDYRSGLRQLRRLDSLLVTPSQRARAEALKTQWEAALTPAG